MGPRVGLSSILILGAVVLLIAIVVGQNMGNSVLRQIAGRPAALSETPVPTFNSSADPGDPAGPPGATLWKRHEVISVATDPAFPDPRVTPEPPPPETPRPAPSRKPSPSPAPAASDAGVPNPNYTSPPMPIPLHTHDPNETPQPEDSTGTAPEASPSAASPGPHPAFTGRGNPTVPPNFGTPIP